MRHPHYEIINAALLNTEIILFCRESLAEEWRKCRIDTAVHYYEYEYFACLPQHKEACLHWLSGGDALVKDDEYDESERVITSSAFSGWHCGTVFMSAHSVRIKPRKEKRWIAYHNSGFMFSEVGTSKLGINERVRSHELSDFVESHWQYKEIEVEV